MNVFYLIWIALLSYALPSSLAGDAAFFRLVATNQTSIETLNSGGIMTWSNSVPQGSFLVERKMEISGEIWAPWTRGLFANANWSVKVIDFSPPGGMLFIPGGTFRMGDSQGDTNVFNVANPVHTVRVSPFFMDRYEFTNQKMRQVLQWAFDGGLVQVVSNEVVGIQSPTNALVVLGKLDSEIAFTNGTFSVRAGRNNFPAEYVSWFGAAACCNYLSEMTGRETCYNLADWTCDFTKRGYRLPTEAEWEFAARGGYDTLRFPWGDTNVITHSRANYNSDTNNWYDVSPTRGYHPDYTDLRPRSSPVGSFAPNGYGLYDVAGNAWEWVGDWHSRYPSTLQVDPKGPSSGSNRIFRGGSWFTKAERLTCAMRYPSVPTFKFDDVSFRMVMPATN